MRMVKVILGTFILLLGAYCYLTVREISPMEEDSLSVQKDVIVERVSSKLSSKRLSSPPPVKKESFPQVETEVLKPIEEEKNESKALNQEDSELEEIGTMTEEEVDKLEAYFDGVEKNWKKKMADFIRLDLGFSEGAVEEYEELRDEYEEEKISAMEEFHEQMEEKYGESYLLEPHQEQEYFQNKVQGKYFDKVKKLFGEEGFDRYLEVIGDYNEKIKEEQDPENGVFLIEL